MTALPWYKDGLNFKCTECGKCCTGTTGFVWVTNEEIHSMAATLNVPEKTFRMKYIRNRDNHFALIERKNPNGDFDCIFLKDKKCQVYQARPKQCRTFPWWKENLESKESWKQAALDCEGINDEAPLIPYSDILIALQSHDSKDIQ